MDAIVLLKTTPSCIGCYNIQQSEMIFLNVCVTITDKTLKMVRFNLTGSVNISEEGGGGGGGWGALAVVTGAL